MDILIKTNKFQKVTKNRHIQFDPKKTPNKINWTWNIDFLTWNSEGELNSPVFIPDLSLSLSVFIVYVI